MSNFKEDLLINNKMSLFKNFHIGNALECLIVYKKRKKLRLKSAYLQKQSKLDQSS